MSADSRETASPEFFPEEGSGTPLWRSLPAGKREQVVQAAVEEFATHGYESASLNTVVRRAGISKGSLFTYFPSKAQLFDSLVGLAAGGVRADLKTLRDRTRQESFQQRLEALLRSGFDFLDMHPQLARIWFHVLPGGHVPLGRRQVDALRGRSREFLEELILDGQARGELRLDLAAARLATQLNLHLEALLRAWQEREGPEQAEDRLRREEWIGDFLALTLRGMARGREEEA